MSQPYTGVRILDLTYWCGAYAGRLFSDLGAEVIRIEPPQGLPDREENGAAGRFAFLNAGKKSVVIDVADPRQRAQLDRLLATAQIVFLERDGPLFDEAAQLRERHPACVVTAISPFGGDGPLANAPASDLVLQSAGGLAWMSGRIDNAPLSLPLGQASMIGGIYAATASAVALVDAEASGTGHLIDVSVQECIAHSLQNALQVWDLEGRISIRGGEGTRDASEDVFPCRDGFIFFACPLALGNAWKSFVAWARELGHACATEFAKERWSNREWRLTQDARDEFRRHFVPFSTDFSKEELIQGALARRIVLGPVNKVSEIFDDPQLSFRKFFFPLDISGSATALFPSAPYQLSLPVWSVSAPPELGENSEIIQHMADDQRESLN